MIYETSFRNMRHGEGRDKVVNSEVSIVHFNTTGGGGRSIGDTFIMVKVTGLTSESINDIAQASLMAVQSAKHQGKGE